MKPKVFTTVSKKDSIAAAMSTTDADIVDANSLDTDQFCADYLHRAQPVVIRNHVTSWPAFTHWDFNYLKSKVGDNVVHIRRHTNKHEYKVDIYAYTVLDLLDVDVSFNSSFR